jgi:hypothetical protein
MALRSRELGTRFDQRSQVGRMRIISALQTMCPRFFTSGKPTFTIVPLQKTPLQVSQTRHKPSKAWPDVPGSGA